MDEAHRAQRIAIPDAALRVRVFDERHYAVAFRIAIPADAAACPPEQWIRSTFEGAPG